MNQRLLVTIVVFFIGLNVFFLGFSAHSQIALFHSGLLEYSPVSGYGDILIVPVTSLRSLTPGECQIIRFQVSAKPSFDGLSWIRIMLAPAAFAGEPVCNYRPDYPGCEGTAGTTDGTTTDTTQQPEETWETWTGVSQPMRTVTIDIRGGLYGSGGSISASPNTGCLEAEPKTVSVRAGEATYVNMQVCSKCSFQPSGGIVMEASYTDSSGKTVSDAMMSPMGICQLGTDTAVANSGCNPHVMCNNRASPDGCFGVGNNGDDCHVTPDSVHCKCYESCLAHYEGNQPFVIHDIQGTAGVVSTLTSTITQTYVTQCTTLVTTVTTTASAQQAAIILDPVATSPLVLMGQVLNVIGLSIMGASGMAYFQFRKDDLEA